MCTHDQIPAGCTDEHKSHLRSAKQLSVVMAVPAKPVRSQSVRPQDGSVSAPPGVHGIVGQVPEVPRRDLPAAQRSRNSTAGRAPRYVVHAAKEEKRRVV